MALNWDYTKLAAPYVKRVDYSPEGIDRLVAIAGVTAGMKACDVGAGVAHLTIPLATRGLEVDAVEPNDAMRELGIKRTSRFPRVAWTKGTGEETGRPSKTYDFVTFGSSFNVTDRALAMKETIRILKPRGWFACMWNHRNLDDPLQKSVEGIIASKIPGYEYGTRREDQAPVIEASGLFEKPEYLEAPVVHHTNVTDWVEAWRSHATLERQAGANFGAIVTAIEEFLRKRGPEELDIPYSTRIWVARAKA